VLGGVEKTEKARLVPPATARQAEVASHPGATAIIRWGQALQLAMESGLGWSVVSALSLGSVAGSDVAAFDWFL
jgi:hypothetical protein